MIRYGTVKRLYLREVEREFPLWFDEYLNPTPPDVRFDEQLESIQETLTKRKGKPIHIKEALRVFKHLLNRWSGGVLGYNSWYAVGTAQDMGLLDRKYRPVRDNTIRVNEESRVRSELVRAGGPQALGAYLDATRPKGKP